MSGFAYTMAMRGWTLRSGCAPGADSAFEQGALDAHLLRSGVKPELFLPWPRFEGRRRILVALEEPSEQAYELAAKHHPAWGRLGHGARALHARNCHQVLGKDLDDPVAFLVCWTHGANSGGGTGQAIRLARSCGVPTYDLADANTFLEAAELISER